MKLVVNYTYYENGKENLIPLEVKITDGNISFLELKKRVDKLAGIFDDVNPSSMYDKIIIRGS